MDLHNKDVLQYLQDLIIKDLANHFNGDPMSLMSADDLQFSLSPDDLKFRRSLFKHIMLKQADPTLTPITSGPGINEHNWYQKINEGAAKEIADSLEKGHKIQAIKTLRGATGFGLREAKHIIDSFLDSSHASSIIERKQASQKFLAKCYGGAFTNTVFNKPWQL